MTDTPRLTNRCREEFERWTPTFFHGNHWSLARHIDTGAYLWAHVDDAWKVWNAARSRCRHPEDCDYPDCGTRTDPNAVRCEYRDNGK